MSFFKTKQKNIPPQDKKIPPVGAFSHYNKKQSVKAQMQSAKSDKIIIEVDSITLAYEGRPVIENLSFNVKEGDYLCIVGENGSGKSTLMNSLLGLMKPISGKIKFNSLTRNEIGVLPQQTPVQSDFPATVQEIVLSGCLSRKSRGPFLSKGSKELAFQSLEKLGITPLANRLFRELSGGQRQRVLLARALCSAEKLLILDEPVTGLDPASTKDIYSLLDGLNQEGMTIITVTHDIPSALRFGSKILRINKDSVFFGSAEEYKSLPEAASLAEDKQEDKPYGEQGFRYNDDDK